MELRIDPEGEAHVVSPWSAAGPPGEATGDLGRLEDGLLHLDGRVSDQINIHGRKTSRARIEGVLAGCPGVSDAAVDMVVGADGDQHVIAYLVSGQADIVKTVTAACLLELPAFARPKRFVLRAALPRTERGKLRRDQLTAGVE